MALGDELLEAAVRRAVGQYVVVVVVEAGEDRSPRGTAYRVAGEGLLKGGALRRPLRVGDPDSTYIQEPTFFKDMSPEAEDLKDITGARVLVKVGDSVTTDHISPAGAIPSKMPTGQYLFEKRADPRNFNSYGSRRSNHEVWCVVLR